MTPTTETIQQHHDPLKILFIQPVSPSSEKLSRRFLYKIRAYPPLTFETLTAVTPTNCDISIIDERFQTLDYTTPADLVGITCMTPEAPRTYQIADEFRRRGATVVLGGWHVSALPNEAKPHADSIVLGEAENLWPQLIHDYQNHALQPVYKNDKPVDLTMLPAAQRNARRKIMFVAAMQASRGCPMGCEFCAASNCLDGHRHRKRDITQIVNEIRSLKEHYLYFYDPSFTINPKYTKELFRAMADLHKSFVCFANIDLLDRDEEFLTLARKAGCRQFFIGFESINQETINALHKRSNTVEKYAATIKKIHNHGISIVGGFIFGFDTDTLETFDQAIEYHQTLDVDFLEFTTLTPYPGTPLFDRLDREGRILTRDWSLYTQKGNVVFQPKNMTPEQLLSETRRVNQEFNSFSGMSRRILRFKRMEPYRIVNNILQYL